MTRKSDTPRIQRQHREMPTQKQIRNRCRKIQEDWSETTRRQRSGQRQRPWTVPEMRAVTSNVSTRLIDGQP